MKILNNLIIGRRVCGNIIKKHHTILDLGCGKGVWGDFAKGRAFCGIDIDIKHNPEHYLSMNYANLDKYFPFYRIGKFDLVIAKDIIEHLDKPEQTLKEIHRVLQTGGELIVKVPDWRSKNAWEDYTHKKPYTKNSIQNLLKDNGFTITKVVRLGGHFLPSMFPQAFSWMVIATK